MGMMDDCTGKYPLILRDRQEGNHVNRLVPRILKVWQQNPPFCYLSAVGFCCSPSLWGGSCACPGSLSVRKRHPWPGVSRCYLVDPGSPLSPSVAVWPPSLYSHSGPWGWRNSKACRSLEGQRTYSVDRLFPNLRSQSFPYRRWSCRWAGSPVHQAGSVYASWVFCALLQGSCCCLWTWGCSVSVSTVLISREMNTDITVVLNLQIITNVFVIKPLFNYWLHSIWANNVNRRPTTVANMNVHFHLAPPGICRHADLQCPGTRLPPGWSRRL